MLREYQLTNFKAFAGPETIPIRPITLIYGPNSSGKSSILQSLLMLKQTIEEAENPETPLLPKGTLVDLGSYRDFVHHHDVANQFSFKAIFSIDKPPQIPSLLGTTDPVLAGLRVSIACNEKNANMVLVSFDVFADAESLPIITYEIFGTRDEESRKRFRSFFELGDEDEIPEKFLQVSMVNSEHAFWRRWWAVTKQQMEERLRNMDSIVLHSGAEDEEELFPPFEKFRQYLENCTFEEAVMAFDEANKLAFLSFRNFLPAGVLRGPYPVDLPFDVATFSLPDEPSWPRPDVSFVTLRVSALFRQFVKGLVYIGPLRDYPERYYIFSGDVGEYVGKSGKMMAGVLFKNPELLKRVNTQLDRFGLGYKLQVPSVSEDPSFSGVFGLRLIDQTGVNVSMLDVGFGISQVLPIIVQSMFSCNRTLLIEQPELHLHPALQAELGDLFIQSALGEQRNTFILETHSEHLILRIMRRMRDTANGTLPAGLPSVRPEDVAVLYVQPKGSTSVVRVLELDQEGQLLDPWPGGFFEEGFRERFA